MRRDHFRASLSRQNPRGSSPHGHSHLAAPRPDTRPRSAARMMQPHAQQYAMYPDVYPNPRSMPPVGRPDLRTPAPHHGRASPHAMPAQVRQAPAGVAGRERSDIDSRAFAAGELDYGRWREGSPELLLQVCVCVCVCVGRRAIPARNFASISCPARLLSIAAWSTRARPVQYVSVVL